MAMNFRSVLFTKQDCLPCIQTKDALLNLLKLNPSCGNYIATLEKENHSALVVAYELEMYPTLLVVDDKGEEVGRFTGGKKVREYLPGVLATLRIMQCA
jgi:hypothetical protein